MASQGHDLRDLFRPGSGLSWRRLGVLIEWLPAEAPLWAELRAAHERSLKPTPEQIRERAAHYNARAKEAT